MARSKVQTAEVQFFALGRDWYADVQYRVSGRYHAATLTDPEEYPTNDIEDVLLTGTAPTDDKTGDIMFAVPLSIDYFDLPVKVQDRIEDAVNEHASAWGEESLEDYEERGDVERVP